MGTLGMYDYAQRAEVSGNVAADPAAAAAPQPVTLPATFHPPAGARLLALVLAGACPGAPAAPAPKLSGFRDSFQQSITTNPQWAYPLDYLTGTTTLQEDPSRSALVWDGHGNGVGASRGTAAVIDATAALVTFDVLQLPNAIGYQYLPNGEHAGAPAELSTWLEDRAANQRLRYRVTHLPTGGDGDDLDAAYRLDLLTERTEGGVTVIASTYARNKNLAVRAVRAGFNADGTARFEVLRSPVGQAEQWEGLASAPLPNAFASAWNPAAVYLHLEYHCESYIAGGATIANLRGSRPVGPAAAVAGFAITATGMKRLDGKTGPYVVPQGRTAIVDTVAASLLVADGGAPDPTHPHAVADVWARLLVDGAPMEGLCELRPAAVLALGTAPAGTLFRVERRGCALVLQSGQQLAAELVARDSNAAHVVALEINGWTYNGGA